MKLLLLGLLFLTTNVLSQVDHWQYIHPSEKEFISDIQGDYLVINGLNRRVHVGEYRSYLYGRLGQVISAMNPNPFSSMQMTMAAFTSVPVRPIDLYYVKYSSEGRAQIIKNIAGTAEVIYEHGDSMTGIHGIALAPNGDIYGGFSRISGAGYEYVLRRLRFDRASSEYISTDIHTISRINQMWSAVFSLQELGNGNFKVAFATQEVDSDSVLYTGTISGSRFIQDYREVIGDNAWGVGVEQNGNDVLFALNQYTEENWISSIVKIIGLNKVKIYTSTDDTLFPGSGQSMTQLNGELSFIKWTWGSYDIYSWLYEKEGASPSLIKNYTNGDEESRCQTQWGGWGPDYTLGSIQFGKDGKLYYEVFRQDAFSQEPDETTPEVRCFINEFSVYADFDAEPVEKYTEPSDLPVMFASAGVVFVGSSPADECILDLPPESQYRQNAGGWENDIYDGTILKMSSKGCAVTSATNVINYFISQQGSPSPQYLTPGIVNSRLTIKNGGYLVGGDLVWNMVPQIAYAGLIQGAKYQSGSDKGDFEAVKKIICEQKVPVILKVPGSTQDHFIVAYGVTTAEGFETFLITDPFDPRNEIQNLYQSKYKNKFRGYRVYSYTPPVETSFRQMKTMSTMSLEDEVTSRNYAVLSSSLNTHVAILAPSGIELDDGINMTAYSEGYDDMDLSDGYHPSEIENINWLHVNEEGDFLINVSVLEAGEISLIWHTYDYSGTLNGLIHFSGYLETGNHQITAPRSAAPRDNVELEKRTIAKPMVIERVEIVKKGIKSVRGKIEVSKLESDRVTVFLNGKVINLARKGSSDTFNSKDANLVFHKDGSFLLNLKEPLLLNTDSVQITLQIGTRSYVGAYKDF